MCHNHDNCGMNDLELLYEWGFSDVHIKFHPIVRKGEQRAYVCVASSVSGEPSAIEGHGMTPVCALRSCREAASKVC